MEEQGNSPSSSIDSSNCPSFSSISHSQSTRRDLTTDLRLGLCLSNSFLDDSSSNGREQLSDWPPINSLLRSRLMEEANHEQPSTFFVKVYMDGVPIGRKLDLFALSGYESLIKTLRKMFRTTITYPDDNEVPSSKANVLTYEDQEGDWMVVGDVPWEMFLNTVKRLKIIKVDKC